MPTYNVTLHINMKEMYYNVEADSVDHAVDKVKERTEPDQDEVINESVEVASLSSD